MRASERTPRGLAPYAPSYPASASGNPVDSLPQAQVIYGYIASPRHRAADVKHIEHVERARLADSARNTAFEAHCASAQTRQDYGRQVGHAQIGRARGRLLVMAYDRQALIRRTQFDAFLYAHVLEESNGMPLSVLSVLARGQLDPWEEASRLAQLPREAATRFLTTLIAALPAGISGRADAEVQAKRLSALLPAKGEVVDQPSDEKSFLGKLFARGTVVRSVVIYVLITAVFLTVRWLIRRG
jgi:hypothetical protein